MMKRMLSVMVAVMFLAGSILPGGVWAEGAAQAASASDETVPAVPATVADAGAPAEPPAAGPAAKEEMVSTTPGNVTVNFKGADIRTVLAYLSEVAGVDIVPSPDVKGTVDLKLTNKPWKRALDIIVRNYGYAYEREGDIIRVVTLDRLRQEEPITQTYTLNYGNAKSVVEALKGMVSNPDRIRYDERTNMIIVTDQPTKLYKIGQVIESLDKMTEQVLIEAVIVETELGDHERLGIKWTAIIEASGAKRPTTFPFDYYAVDNPLLDKYSPLSQTGVTTTVLSPGGQTTETPPGLYPAGAEGPSANAKGFPFVDYTSDLFQDSFIFGTLDFSQFKAVMEMIKERADAEVISNPRILTLDNQPATIHVGETVMLPKFERNSTTGKMEITGYEYSETTTDPETGKETTKGLKSGVNLRVVPHINEKMEIVVDLEPSISDSIVFRPLDPEGNIRAPQINERTANTQARINDGETIFIGGLIHERDEEIENKLPILGDMMGDVPYLGLLVNHKSIQKKRRELIFFITVNIIKPGKEIAGSPKRSDVVGPDYTMIKQMKEAAETRKKKKGWFNF